MPGPEYQDEKLHQNDDIPTLDMFAPVDTTEPLNFEPPAECADNAQPEPEPEPPSRPSLFGQNLFGHDIEPSRSMGKLGEQFIVPPFSVLDTRQGYWQERKRAWVALGIRSELGRVKDAQATGKGSVYGGTSAWAEPRGPATEGETAKLVPEKPAGGNLLKFSAAMSITRNGQGFDGGKIYSGEIEREGAEANSTSIFDPVLCELAYRWFCPPLGLVFDPFAGGSVRGVVAGLLGRDYVGMELRAEQVEANRMQWIELGVQAMGAPELRVQWIEADSRDCGTFLQPESVDLVFSCPPYADLERYSDDPRDLSTLEYDQFCVEYGLIIQSALTLLKPNRFAVFVVTEIRGPKQGFYRGFVSDTVKAFECSGARFYNEAALINCAGSLPLRVQKQFNVTRKLGRTHQYVLVFLKGDPREAAKACQEEGE